FRCCQKARFSCLCCSLSKSGRFHRRSAKPRTFEATSGEARRCGGERATIRRELGHIAVPQGIRALRTDNEVGPGPEITFAIKHQFAGRSQTAASKLERQDPSTRRKT